MRLLPDEYAFERKLPETKTEALQIRSCREKLLPRNPAQCARAPGMSPSESPKRARIVSIQCRAASFSGHSRCKKK